MIQRWKPFCSRALLISLTCSSSRVSMVTAEYAGIHLVAVGRTVVMNSGDVAAQACDDGGYLYQLARLVVQLHLDGAETSTLHQSTVDDTVEDGYVDVTAAYHADGLLALHRHLVVHHGSHTGSSGTFCHHLLALEELQDGCADLVLAYGDDFVHIVGAGFKVILPGSFTAIPSATVATDGSFSCLWSWRL